MSELTEIEQTALIVLHLAGSTSLKKLTNPLDVTVAELSKWKYTLLNKKLTIEEFKLLLATFLREEEVNDIICRVFFISSYDGCLSKTGGWKKR
tara:strand:- start:1122 stop:1403 length:282 start_codon:yes stop_codon:yes gene_type:complete